MAEEPQDTGQIPSSSSSDPWLDQDLFGNSEEDTQDSTAISDGQLASSVDPLDIAANSVSKGSPAAPSAAAQSEIDSKDYISISEAADQLLAARARNASQAEYYALIEDLYSKSNTHDPEVAQFYAELGQKVKDRNNIIYEPDFAKLVPPLEYSGFDSLDDKKAAIDLWKERAKSQLQLVMGSEYGLNKLGIDSKIDAMAKQRKRELSAIAKYGEDTQGNVADSGGVSDVVSRLGQGFVADTLKSVGATDLAESAEDFFVENPRFDADTTSKVAGFLGMGAGNLALGMAAAAMTGGLGVALGAGAKAGAAIEGATALAETGVELSATSPIAALLKSPLVTPARIGAATSAGTGAYLVEQDVYEQVYEQTGSRRAATRASLMSLSGVALGSLAHYFIAAGIMEPLSKATFSNKAAIVDAVSNAVEHQTDLQGTAALREALKTAYSAADSKIKSAAVGAVQSGIVGAAGLSVMNASIEDAISANVLTMKDTGFDIANQGESAALGFLAGMITGGIGGAIKGPNPKTIEKVNKVYDRINKREAQLHQAIFDELAAKPQSKQTLDTGDFVGAKPAEEPPAAPGAAAEAAQTPEQQVLTVKEEATNKIAELIQQEASLSGKQSELQAARDLVNFGNPGEKINLDAQIAALEQQRGLLANERAGHERTIEIADLQDRIVSEQKRADDLVSKITPENRTETQAELVKVRKGIADLESQLAEKKGLEPPKQSEPELKFKQPEQPKTNEQLLRNRLARQGVNPEIPVEKLTPEQRSREISALNSELAQLPTDLADRKTSLIQHHNLQVDLAKEAELESKLHLDKDVTTLKPNQLNAEQRALENYTGELSAKHEQRLSDVLAQQQLIKEKHINDASLIGKTIEKFTPAEAEHALRELQSHDPTTLTDAQQKRLFELQERTPKLFESLTDEAFNKLPKLTKQLAHDSPTLGDLIAKERHLRTPEKKAAIQQAIDAFKDEKNIQREETTEFKKGVSPETIAKEKARLVERRGARAAHAEREARQAQLEAAHVNAEKVAKKTTRDTGDVRSRLTSFGQTAEAVSEPIQTAKPKVSDTAKTKGGFQSPNEPPKSYAEIRKQQDEVVAKNNTTHKEPYSVPGSDKVELDLTKVANSRREELQKKFPRIAPEKRDPINPPKKMNDILRKVNDYFKVRFRYQGLSKNGSLLGVYTGRIGNAITSAANKASTAVHELGHRLDHMFGIGEDWIKTAGEHKFDSELEKFWVHGSPYKDIIGKRVEGIAEYLHAYMFNEAEARRAAPEFTKFFESKIPAEDLAHIREVGRDFVDRYNSSALELTNLQHQTTEEALNTKSSWLSRLFGDTRTTGSAVPWTTVLFSKFNRDAGNDWIFDHIINELGIDKQDILPQNDPRVWMRGVRKVSGIIQDMFDNGIADLIDPQFNAETGFKRLTKTGYAEIFDPLVGSSNPEFDIHETSSLLLSERTKAILEPVEAKRNELIERASSMEDLVTTENGVEIPNPEKEALNAQIYELNRQLNETTGTSSGFEGRNDLDIARETIAKLEADPERLAKLKQVGENVREWFDGLLTVAEKTGLISSKSAKNMRAKGEFYAPMYRLLEQGVDSFVDSSIDPLSRRHGSTKTIKNLQASLLEASYKLTERAYKNYGKLQMMDFFNPIKVEVSAIKKRLLEEDPSLAKDQARLQELAFDEVNRTKANENVFGGKSTDISNIAYKLEFNGESVEPKGEAERALTTRLIRNGRVEYWKWSDQFLKEQFDKSIDLHNTNIPILAPINNFFKFMVTHASPFAIRNPIRDTFARLFESEAGAKRGLKSTFSGFATDKDIALLRQSMGDQSGYHLRNYADFARFQRQAMYDKGLVKGNIFIPVQKGFKKWGDLVASGERFNRIREYKASFDFAKDQGFSDYDAHLYAGNQASGIMDFTSAGEWMRGLENFFPFASAGSVGVRKMVSTLKAHPGRSMAYFVAMGIIPSLIERTMAKVGGYEKEWDERSPIYKDMFMSFKVADNMWIHVPRFYELAVMSNMANRLLDKWEGKPGSFEGAAANMARSFIPIDPLDIGSPLGAPFEALGNYDTFRQRPIVPVDSETARLSERKEPKTASTISLAIHNALIDWGVDDSFFAKKFGDARKLDYLFLALTGTLGSEALTIQDLAKADKRARYIKKLGGIFGETPATNSRDALFVNDFIASENISPQSKQLQKYALLRDSYYDAETESEKEQAAQKFLAEAERLRHIMETIGPDYFRSAKSIENRRMKKLAAEREKNK